jgi:hypothetical protein
MSQFFGVLLAITTVALSEFSTAQTAPATQPQAHSFPSGKATYDATSPSDVPVKFGAHGLPMVKATLNGKEAPPFVLDTGAGAMVITPKTAELVGLVAEGQIDAIGTGDAVKRATRRGGALRLGPVTLQDCTWLDLPELDGPVATLAFGEPVAGIIGRDFFLSAVVEMDWARQKLILSDPNKAPELPKGISWQILEWVNDLPCVKCRYDGDHQGICMIDTGPDGGVQFDASAVERHKLLDGRKTTGGALAGVGAAAKRASGTIAWFELAGMKHADLAAGFATGAAKPDPPARDGVIGMTLLRRYRIIFDASHSRAAFIPIAANAGP